VENRVARLSKYFYVLVLGIIFEEVMTKTKSRIAHIIFGIVDGG
jgi:hypothetical protein